MNDEKTKAPPTATKEDHPVEAHGHVRNDGYFWMRLSEPQRDADPPDAHTQRVIDHLKAENSYADAVLAPVKELRSSLFKELKARIKETDMSVPYRDHGWWYSTRFEEGKEYAIHQRRADEAGAVEVTLFDENSMA